ncbi:MAG TPA: HAD family hydrolase [bacterium]|nr:HAD family hydrolase [bacterium]
MHTKNFELIIFDLDGTLYPKKEQISAAFRQGAAKIIAEQENLPLKKAIKRIEAEKKKFEQEVNGKMTYTLTLLSRWKVPIPEYERAVNSSAKNVNAIVERDDFALQAVSKVAKNYSTYLYTTNNRLLTDRILKTIHMDHFFPPDRRFTVSSITDLNVGQNQFTDYIKPGRKGFEHILKSVNVSREKTLMVGDSPDSDLRPAEKMGLKTYKVFSRPDLYNLPTWLGLEG